MASANDAQDNLPLGKKWWMTANLGACQWWGCAATSSHLTYAPSVKISTFLNSLMELMQHEPGYNLVRQDVSSPNGK